MKTLPTFFTSVSLIALLFLSGFLTSCKKSEAEPEDPTKGFSTEIQNIVPEAIITSLRARGMAINEGKLPPKVEGTYKAAPFELLSPYGVNDPWQKGKIIADYHYKLYGATADNKISYDFTNNGSDTGKGKGAFVSGNGNFFTIFSEDTGVSSSIPYKTIAVMSGELTATGIRNFQYAFVIKEKTGDDTNTTLIPVNEGRIWKDGDGLAEKTSGFRLQAPDSSGDGKATMGAVR